MKKAHADRYPEEFSVPEGIVFKQVDPKNGLLSTDRCRNSIREAFLSGTEPHQYCGESGAVVSDEIPIQDEAP
jgi:membrane carboxypeptidase/penicillin-binding protein